MYEEALRLQDNFVSSRFHLGLMYHKTNKFQEALKCFSKVLSKIPNDKTVYISRGVVYQDMANHQQAIKDFSRACQIDPKMSEAYFRRGISKLASKNYHDAIKDFGLSEDLEEGPVDKRNAGIPDGIGQCFHSLREYDQAMSFYDQAIEMDETNTDFLMHRS